MSPEPAIEPASPFNPPLNVPDTIALLGAPIGSFVSGVGGGLPRLNGNIVALIDGDDSGVFSVVGLETDTLVHDPDAPRGGRTWETVLTVDGSGPIQIGPAMALLVTVGFAARRSLTQANFTATVVIVAEGTSGPALFQIPIQASVDSVGHMLVVTEACPLLDSGISPGQTLDLQVLLLSSLQHDVTGIFSLDNGPVPIGVPTLSSPQIPVSLPANTTVAVALPVTCAVGAAPGFILSVPFLFTSGSDGDAGISLRILVLSGRTVTVTTDLSLSPILLAGSSTPYKVTVNDSGGPSTIAFQPDLLPPGVSLQLSEPRVIGTGAGGVNPPQVLEMDMVLELGAQLPPGSMPPFRLNWVVPATPSTPEITGFLTFNVNIAFPQVTAPNSGLGSNSNYFLYSPAAQSGVCTNLIGVSLTINVSEDITGSDGFGFQLNAYSAKGDFDGAQQYLVYLSPTSNPPQLTCMANNWNSQTVAVLNSQVELAPLPSHTLPAGYQLTISLQNDAGGNITGATYVAIDNAGKTIGNQTIALLSLSGITSTDLAPIVAFTLNFVDCLNGGKTVLSSGAGSIVYAASNQMAVLNSEPGCVDWNYVTKETANSSYGTLPSNQSRTFTQSFQTAAAAISKQAAVRHITSLELASTDTP
jgi:hypothetical protein